VAEKTAMELTGHRTRAVFDRYDIVDEKDLSLAVGKLAVFHAAETRLRDNHGTIHPIREAVVAHGNA
jgi:hypothetical protein